MSREYKFYIDEKVLMWQRHHYSVAGVNYEEAKERMIEELDKLNMSENMFDSTETLFDTIESPDVIRKQLWTDTGDLIQEINGNNVSYGS